MMASITTMAWMAWVHDDGIDHDHGVDGVGSQ
jgi:hypothetical protein